MACAFQAAIAGKFAPLIGLKNEDMDIYTMINTYNEAVTDRNKHHRKKPWVTKYVLDLRDERTDL